MTPSFRLVAISFLLAGCVSSPAKQNQTTNEYDRPIRFIDAVEISHDVIQDGFRVGGLSSLYLDADTKKLISISDDTSLSGAPRFHTFDIELTTTDLVVTADAMIELVNESSERFQPKETIDAEAFDRLPNGNWIVSSEGIKLNERFTIPQFLEFDPSGVLVKRWPFPDHYMPDLSQEPDTGIRSNAAFEGLDLTPDRQFLMLAAEKAVYQDGGVSSTEQTSQVRVMRMKNDDGVYSEAEEFLYELSKIPDFTDDASVFALIGISDILAVSETRLLIVERSFVASPIDRNTVQVFKVELPKSKSHMYDKSPDTLAKVDKTLWFDMDDFIDVPGFPGIDNVEGVILGPQLENGNQSLLIVSDNNFSSRQKTLFYAFEIVKPMWED